MRNQEALVFALSGLFLLSATHVWAEQDFYGIRMKSESWAKNLVWNAGPMANQNDLAKGPVLSHDITAEASLKEIEDERIDFKVTVFNGTPETLSTDFNFRDFYITTRSGQKYPLIDGQDQPELNRIEPKSSVTFSPSLGNLRVRNKDVMLIECSFDLGKTKVFLFPWSEKNKVAKLINPSILEKPTERPEKGAAPPERIKKSLSQEKTKVVSGVKPKEPRRNFWERLSGQAANTSSRETMVQERERNEAVAVAPATAKAQTRASALVQAPGSLGSRVAEPAKALANSSAKSQGPSVAQPTNRSLDASIKNFVYVPADGEAKTPPVASGNTVTKVAITSTPRQSRPVRAEARVVSVNTAYHFVTLDAGSRDGLRDDMVLSILRDGKIIAKARVKQLREAVSAASLLPEFIQTEIRPGDQISLV